MSRKRALRDLESEASASTSTADQSPETSMLKRIRNDWHFANLYQFICIFGKALKIDDNIDMDVLEQACLTPSSPVLVDIGLCLLKIVSSHRGLTPELFDEYTRRQYVARRPQHNPFGTDETPAKFDDFDVFTKFRVLQQLTQWVIFHFDRFRDRMDEQTPSAQTQWRIEPYGWDKKDRTYFVLDDDRLYRQTDAPPASTWQPKKNTKKAKAAAKASRAFKRRRTSRSAAASADDVDGDDLASDTEEAPVEAEDDGLGGAKWECIAINYAEVQTFLVEIENTRNENEKILRDRIKEGLVPVLKKAQELREKKEIARRKEQLNMEKMAHAKRSSRLAGKAEQQRQLEQAREEDERRRVEEARERKEEQMRLEIEKKRESKLLSREQRRQERDARRLAHEQELEQGSEDSKAQAGEDDDEKFECICEKAWDGAHSIECEECNVWQHSKCLKIRKEEAEREDFHFVCARCRAAKPKIKLKVKRPELPSSSPAADKSQETTTAMAMATPAQAPRSQHMIGGMTSRTVTPVPPPFLNGTQLRRASDTVKPSTIPVKQLSQTPIPLPPSPFTNGGSPNPFSSPHPTLSPPQQSPNKSRAYSTINQPSSPSSSTNRTGEHRSLPPKGIFHVSPKVNGTLPPHADVTVPPVAARSDSPLKQPLDNATKSLPALSPPSISFHSRAAGDSGTAGTAANTAGTTANTAASAIFSTPQLKHSQPVPGSALKTPTLPPVQNGISPLKRSPPPTQLLSNGVHSSPAPAILPPVAALSATPTQQILTPPVKSLEPARPSSQQSNGVSGSS